MKYSQLTSLPLDLVISKIKEFIYEDSPTGDLTSENSISSEQISKINIVTREDIVLSGIDIIELFFEKAVVEKKANDGDHLKTSDIIASIEANTIDLLRFERIILNLMQRMCGIATMTSKYVKIAKPFGVQILDTRKTTPGLRVFEKYSVVQGGGTNHRYDLSSAVMLKDNHIAAIGSITEAVKRMRTLGDDLIIEVEVDTFEQVEEAIKTDLDAILIDNFTPNDTKKLVEYVRNNQKKNIFLESSGGINLENLHEYVGTGVDAISSGALTHSVKSSDIGFDFIL